MRRQPTFTRADRLETLMLDEVERLLSYEVRSPLAQTIKVVAGRLAPDLGHLRVMYIVRDAGGHANPLTTVEPSKPLLEVLEKAQSFIGRTLVEALDLRAKPHVVFVFDKDAQRAQRVELILAEERARLAAAAPEADAATVTDPLLAEPKPDGPT
jgi:ribosome-binding factor A